MSSRVEELLAAAVDGSGTDGLDPPQSRNEKLLFALNDKLDNVQSELAGKVDVPADGQAYQYLVTDGTGTVKWEDRLAYEYTEWKDFTLNYDTAGIEITGFTMPPVGDTVTVKVDGVESVKTVTFLKVDDYRYIRYIGRSPLEIAQGAPGWSIAYYSEGERVLGIAKVPTIVSLLVTEPHNIDQKYVPKEVYFVRFDGSSLDRTFDEITEAYNAGLLVVLEGAGNHGFLNYIDPEKLGFLIPIGNVSVMLYLTANNTIDRELFGYLTTTYNGTLVNNLILPSSTSGSSKKFKITVGDSGNLSTTDDDGNVVTTSSAPWCITPQMFGAVGDGVTDDTAAIQAAIDYAQSSGIRDLYFPAGTYKITAPLIVTTATGTISGISGATSRYYFGIGLRLRGGIAGTTIIRKEGTRTAAITRGSDTYTVDTIIGIQGEGTGFWASDLTLENASPNECYAVYSLRARTNLERCNIATPSHGIYIYGWTNTISDVVIHATEKAVWIENSTSTVLNKVFCHGNNPYCISSYYSTLISCCGDGCTGRMFQLEGTVTMVGCGGESEGVENYLYLTGYNTNVIVDGFTFNRQSADDAVFAYIAQGATCGTHLDMRGMRASEKEGAAGANMYWLDFAAGVVFSAFIGAYTKGRDGSYSWKNEPKISKSSTGAGQIIRLAIGDYFGSYRVNSDLSLTRVDKTILDDASVTPEKTTFIDPASNGEYVQTPLFDNLLTTWTAGQIDSTGAVSSSGTVKYSNQIAVTSGQTVRLRGLGWGASGNFPLGVFFYDASGNFIARRNTTNLNSEETASAGRWNYSYDGETDTVEFKVASTFSSYKFSDTAYIVVVTRNANAKGTEIATVNQQIAYKQLWTGDPQQLNSAVKVPGASLILEAPNGGKYQLTVDNNGVLSAVAYDGDVT